MAALACRAPADALGSVMIHNHDPALGSRVFCGYTAPPSIVCKAAVMNPAEITQLIEAGIAASVVKVFSDDNTHFEALVVAPEFDGKRPLARHQLVYQCLGSLVGNEIHALSITALTPDEWREKSGEA